MQTLDLKAMGSACRLVVDAPEDAREVRARLAAAGAWITMLERRLSRFLEGSELSMLNRARTAEVSAELWEAVDVALRVAESTQGLVTPAVLPALEAAGYDRTFERGFEDPRPIVASTVPSFRAIERDPASRTIHLPEGLRLDLGGTLKGSTADRLARRLQGPALVDLGGDIAVRGAPRGANGWLIGIADPNAPNELLEHIEVADAGVATSGRDHRRWRRGGEEQHHVIDPRTGAPARTDAITATVVAPSALVAEAAAKVVLILGSERGLEWIDAQAELAALVVRDDGRVLRSRHFARLVSD